MENRKVKQVLFGKLVQWEGGGHKKWEEAQCGGAIMYVCMKMEKGDLLKLFQERERRE
jgi:hypothetical protein